jgi:VRR-NUC domain
MASVAGHPDVIICKDGKFIAIEVKTEKGRLSPLQEYRRDEILKNGGIHYVANPNNYKSIIQEIKIL